MERMVGRKGTRWENLIDVSDLRINQYPGASHSDRESVMKQNKEGGEEVGVMHGRDQTIQALRMLHPLSILCPHI